MDKKWFESKTMWGIFLALMIVAGRYFGVVADESLIATIVQVLSLLFAAYGRVDVGNRLAAHPIAVK